jgi:hypothetical protein
MKSNVTITMRAERRRYPGVGLLFRVLMLLHGWTGWSWFALAAIRCAITFSVVHDDEGEA